MKMMNKNSIRRVVYAVVACISLSMVLSLYVHSEIHRPPRTEKDLLGAWVGHDDCGVEYFRVVFKTNKTGSVALSLAEAPPDNFTIATWSQNGYNITCEIRHPEADTDRLSVSFSSASCYLDCQLNWGGAKRQYRLLKEDEHLKRINRLREVQEGKANHRN